MPSRNAKAHGKEDRKEDMPRKKVIIKRDEHSIQCACVQWFRLAYPTLARRLFAVPNGGRRDAVTGAKLKAEGVIAGVADLILLVPSKQYGALLIEMKTGKGRQSESQKEWQSDLTRADEYKYVVCRSFDDFRKAVKEYLNYG